MKYSLGYGHKCYMILHDTNKKTSIMYSSGKEEDLGSDLEKVLGGSEKTIYLTNENYPELGEDGDQIYEEKLKEQIDNLVKQ